MFAFISYDQSLSLRWTSHVSELQINRSFTLPGSDFDYGSCKWVQSSFFTDFCTDGAPLRWNVLG